MHFFNSTHKPKVQESFPQNQPGRIVSIHTDGQGVENYYTSGSWMLVKFCWTLAWVLSKYTIKVYKGIIQYLFSQQALRGLQRPMIRKPGVVTEYACMLISYLWWASTPNPRFQSENGVWTGHRWSLPRNTCSSRSFRRNCHRENQMPNKHSGTKCAVCVEDTGTIFTKIATFASTPVPK